MQRWATSRVLREGPALRHINVRENVEMSEMGVMYIFATPPSALAAAKLSSGAPSKRHTTSPATSFASRVQFNCP
eukprot:COSAG06_NODE_13579_length_1243_cov_0.995629_2_plen_75_part_00